MHTLLPKNDSQQYTGAANQAAQDHEDRVIDLLQSIWSPTFDAAPDDLAALNDEYQRRAGQIATATADLNTFEAQDKLAVYEALVSAEVERDPAGPAPYLQTLKGRRDAFRSQLGLPPEG
jgi:hypothetical protein